MSEIGRALRTLHNRELAGLAVGDEAPKMRAFTSLSLVTASKVIDRLGFEETLRPAQDEIDPDTGKRLGVYVSRLRSGQAIIPEGFESTDTPNRSITLSEIKTKIYRPYPFGLRSIFSLLSLRNVTMREDGVLGEGGISISGSNKLGVNESRNTPKELLIFSANLALISKACGFYEELTRGEEGIFLHEGVLGSLTD